MYVAGWISRLVGLAAATGMIGLINSVHYHLFIFLQTFFRRSDTRDINYIYCFPITTELEWLDKNDVVPASNPHNCTPGTPMVTWIKFNPGIDKQSYEL